jgi:uncharacterized protein (DUF2267 family)
MSVTGLEVFDTTLQKTNEWLQQIMQELGTESKQEAYIALRATLHTLRDRLPLEVVAHMGAQFPMLVRGIYYEGWKPSLEVCKLHYNEFLTCVLSYFVRASLETSDPEPAVRAVFHTVARNIAPGETQKVMNVLPADLRSLWETANTTALRAEAT